MGKEEKSLYSCLKRNVCTSVKLTWDVQDLDKQMDVIQGTKSVSSPDYPIKFARNKNYICRLKLAREAEDDQLIISAEFYQVLPGSPQDPDGSEQVVPARPNSYHCNWKIKAILLNEPRELFFVEGSCCTEVGFPVLELTSRKNELKKMALRITIQLEVFGERENSAVVRKSADECSISLEPPLEAKELPFLKKINRKHLSDVVIKCGNEEFPAHKLVLSCASPVFSRMFETGMSEAASGEVVINDTDRKTMGRLLEYIYTGKFVAPTDDAVVRLFYCAEKYELEELKQMLLSQMICTLSDDNAALFALTAAKFGASEDTKKALFGYCKRNFSTLARTTEFKELLRLHRDELL